MRWVEHGPWALEVGVQVRAREVFVIIHLCVGVVVQVEVDIARAVQARPADRYGRELQLDLVDAYIEGGEVLDVAKVGPPHVVVHLALDSVVAWLEHLDGRVDDQEVVHPVRVVVPGAVGEWRGGTGQGGRETGARIGRGQVRGAIHWIPLSIVEAEIDIVRAIAHGRVYDISRERGVESPRTR